MARVKCFYFGNSVSWPFINTAGLVKIFVHAFENAVIDSFKWNIYFRRFGQLIYKEKTKFWIQDFFP